MCQALPITYTIADSPTILMTFPNDTIAVHVYTSYTMILPSDSYFEHSSGIVAYLAVIIFFTYLSYKWTNNSGVFLLVSCGSTKSSKSLLKTQSNLPRE
jgi:hypothetical protein